ncbi:MAG: hypothetical protein JSR92_19805 [Proteobacteria bacterium]|nr:hypothetical protein [Pseudomonadota bacterium]
MIRNIALLLVFGLGALYLAVLMVVAAPLLLLARFAIGAPPGIKRADQILQCPAEDYFPREDLA